MRNQVTSTAAVAMIALAGNVNAASFSSTETFSGTFSLSDNRQTYTELHGIVPGGSNLPPLFASDAYRSSASFVTGFGTFSGGNANGEYFGSFQVTSFIQRGSSNVWDLVGNYSYTNGTGVFSGIAGSGVVTGFNTFLTDTTGTTFRQLNGSFTVPIPEPSSYAMMLAGLLVLGALARRRRP